jgi:hypothetical protein
VRLIGRFFCAKFVEVLSIGFSLRGYVMECYRSHQGSILISDMTKLRASTESGLPWVPSLE